MIIYIETHLLITPTGIMKNLLGVFWCLVLWQRLDLSQMKRYYSADMLQIGTD
jgi:hypothetical protein